MNEEISDLLKQAWKHRNNNNYKVAKEQLDKISTLIDREDYFLWGKIYGYYGQIERDQQSLNSAIVFYLKAFDSFEEIENEMGMAHTIRHVADIETELGQNLSAKEHYQKALSIYNANSDTHIVDLANTLRGFALLNEKIDNKIEAKKNWTEARDLYARANIQAGVDECSNHLLSL